MREKEEAPAKQQNDESSDKGNKKTKLRWYVIALTHLPWASSLVCIIVFIACVFLPGMPLVQVKNTNQSLWEQIDFLYEGLDAIVRIILGLFFTFVTAYCCFKAQKFDWDTADMLKVMDPKEMDPVDNSAKPDVNKSGIEPITETDADSSVMSS